MLGEHPPVGREVRTVERVVHDKDRRTLREIACPLGEAIGPVVAVGAARTLTARATHRRPGRVRNVVVDLGAVAGLRLVGEGAQAMQVLRERDAHRLFEQCVGCRRGAQLRPAEIIRTALEEHEREGHVDVFLERRKVFRHELALQRDGRGRDDDLEPRRDGRGEVGEALARPGGRLGDEMVAGADGVGDRGRERHLPVALLAAEAARRRRREPPSGRRATRRADPTGASPHGTPRDVGRTLLAMRLRRSLPATIAAFMLPMVLATCSSSSKSASAVSSPATSAAPAAATVPTTTTVAPVACHPAAGYGPGTTTHHLVVAGADRTFLVHMPPHADYRDATRRRLPRRDLRHVPAGHLQRVRSRRRQVRLRRRDARTESTPRSASGDSSARSTTCTSQTRSCARSRRTHA